VTIKKISILSKEECEKYWELIPYIDTAWWLRTPCDNSCIGVRVIDLSGHLSNFICGYDRVGVRPACWFEIDLADPAFWRRKLVGTKIQFGNYIWTVLDINDNEVFALCDKSIANRCFDSENNLWESSKLKNWLEVESLKILNKEVII
jgi:hypothetical protein